MSNITVNSDGIDQVNLSDGKQGDEFWPQLAAERFMRFARHVPIDCVFDVGAGRGQYAQLLRRLGFSGTILSFEAQPEAAAQARERAVDDKSWHVFDLTRSRMRRKAGPGGMPAERLSQAQGRPGDANSIAGEKLGAPTDLAIPASDLKTQFHRLRDACDFKLPFLKMATLGSNLDIIRAGADVIPYFAGIQCEMPLRQQCEGALNFPDALIFLKNKSFKLYSSMPNNVDRIPETLAIDCIMLNSMIILSSSRQGGDLPAQSGIGCLASILEGAVYRSGRR